MTCLKRWAKPAVAAAAGPDPWVMAFFGSLRSLAARWSVVYLAPLELTPTSFSALFRLSHHPGITGAALARLILITPQGVGPLLDGMDKSGLVLREQPGMGRPIHTRRRRRVASAWRRRYRFSPGWTPSWWRGYHLMCRTSSPRCCTTSPNNLGQAELMPPRGRSAVLAKLGQLATDNRRRQTCALAPSRWSTVRACAG